MRVRTKEFIKQLAEEFNMSPTHIEVIIMEPFRFWVDFVRKKEKKSYRIMNFGVIYPKKSFKDNETGHQGDNPSDNNSNEPLGRAATNSETTGGEV